MEFEVKGKYEHQEKRHAFTTAIRTTSEKRARELTYAKLGSNHGINRRHIQIQSIQENKKK
ncbi:MAG: 50S ribosomal protein L18a [Candidatus Diapherotrites archaeon]|nr:50S ribosomal protein L18a [Candidatus Diapherotrites archaeon]